MAKMLNSDDDTESLHYWV